MYCVSSLYALIYLVISSPMNKYNITCFSTMHKQRSLLIDPSVAFVLFWENKKLQEQINAVEVCFQMR